MRFCACTVHFNKRFLKVSLWVGDVLKWQESSFEREKNLKCFQKTLPRSQAPPVCGVPRLQRNSPESSSQDFRWSETAFFLQRLPQNAPPPPCHADVTGRQSASRPRGAGFPVSDEDPTFCPFSDGQSSPVGWGLACSFTYVCHRQRRATRGLRGWLAREMVGSRPGACR